MNKKIKMFLITAVKWICILIEIIAGIIVTLVAALIIIFTIFTYTNRSQQVIEVPAAKQRLYLILDSRGEDNYYVSISRSPTGIFGFHFINEEKDYVYKNSRIFLKASNDTVYIYCERKIFIPPKFNFNGTILQIEYLNRDEEHYLFDNCQNLGLYKCPEH